jgi:hypothetical protein
MHTQASEETERQLAYTTAALLRAAAPLFWLNLLLFAAVWWRLWPLPGLPLWLLGIAALLVGLAALVLQVRLGFDARLFDGFARGRQTPPQLDSALYTLGLAKPLSPRSMALRCAGALRLARLWQCLTGLQILLLLCMLAL